MDGGCGSCPMRVTCGLQPGFGFFNLTQEETEEGEGKVNDTGKVHRVPVTICPSVGRSRAEKNNSLPEETGAL